jgi:hypothetical protein
LLSRAISDEIRATRMSAIDEAFDTLRQLLGSWKSGKSPLGADLSEADTRAKVIDPLFKDVLGWPEELIVREEPSGDGYADYVLRDRNRAYALVEAKRVLPRFQLPRTTTRDSYVIGGPALSDKHVKAAIMQAAGYGPTLGCPYAMVTNGLQFVVFRSIVELPLRSRKARIFSNLEDPQDFRDFFELLSYDAMRDGALHEYFLQLEEVKVRLTPRDRLSHPDRELTRNKLWSVLSHLATRVLEDRPESRLDIIENCYVPTQEGNETDNELKQLIERDPAMLVTEMGGQPVGTGSRSGMGRALQAAIKDRKSGVYVLTGSAGSGKTTYLSRFQHIVEPQLAREWCAWFHVDFLPSGKPSQTDIDIEPFIYRKIREHISQHYGNEIKNDGVSLREMFAAELKELESTLLFDVPQDSQQRTDLINAEIYQLVKDDHSFCRAAIRRLIGLGRRAVFVLDNSDQLGEDFQERVFLAAKSIQDDYQAICIVSLREEKFYAAYYRGVFNAFPTNKFYIGSPDLQEVLRKRIEYGMRLMKANPGDFFSGDASGTRSLTLSDCLTLLSIFVTSVTKRNRNIVRLLESVAAGNIRFGLDIFRDFVGSGNTDVSDILKKHLDNGPYSVPFHQFIKSVMLGNREFYRSGNSPIVNVFAVSAAPRASHFTALRILRYLQDRQGAPSIHGAGFVDTAEMRREYAASTDLLDDFDQTLGHLVQKNLVESEPPRTPDVAKSVASKIAAAGSYYLRFLAQSVQYLDLAAFDTPLIDSNLVNRYASTAFIKDMGVRLERVREFLEYLVKCEASELALVPFGSPFAMPLMPGILGQARREMTVICEKLGIPNPNTT